MYSRSSLMHMQMKKHYTHNSTRLKHFTNVKFLRRRAILRFHKIRNPYTLPLLPYILSNFLTKSVRQVIKIFYIQCGANKGSESEEWRKACTRTGIQWYTNSESWYPLVHHRAQCWNALLEPCRLFRDIDRYTLSLDGAHYRSVSLRMLKWATVYPRFANYLRQMSLNNCYLAKHALSIEGKIFQQNFKWIAR